MSIYAPLRHVHQSRTIKPRYARTQATPQAVTLDPAYDVTKGDIFPGSVLTRLSGDRVTLCDGTTAPAGLSGNWHAPVFGLDEVGTDGSWDMSMWVLGNDAQMEVYAPAFDTAAPWALADAELDKGNPVYLTATADGLLTIQSESPRPAVAAIAAVRPTGAIKWMQFCATKEEAKALLQELKGGKPEAEGEDSWQDFNSDNALFIGFDRDKVKTGDKLEVTITTPDGKEHSFDAGQVPSDDITFGYWSFDLISSWTGDKPNLTDGQNKVTLSRHNDGVKAVAIGNGQFRTSTLDSNEEFIKKPNELTAAKLVRRLGTNGIVVAGL